MQSLPPEILVQIAKHLDETDLLNLIQVIRIPISLEVYTKRHAIKYSSKCNVITNSIYWVDIVHLGIRFTK